MELMKWVHGICTRWVCFIKLTDSMYFILEDLEQGTMGSQFWGFFWAHVFSMFESIVTLHTASKLYIVWFQRTEMTDSVSYNLKQWCQDRFVWTRDTDFSVSTSIDVSIPIHNFQPLLMPSLLPISKRSSHSHCLRMLLGREIMRMSVLDIKDYYFLR